MRQLKVGIIGVGMAFERLHHPAFQQLQNRYAIVALADMDREKALAWAGRLHLSPENIYTDWREMLRREDLDVVDILVPIEENYEVTKGVAEILAGQRKGIICEKPLAPSLEQAEAARELPRKYNVPIMIAENYRYNEEINIIRDLVRTGHIGQVYYFIQNRFIDFPTETTQNKFPARDWRQHPEFPGGVITDTAVHDFAGLRHIFGGIDRLQAFGRPLNADYAPYAVVNVNLLFRSGVTGQFTFFCAGKEAQRPLTGLRIFGSQGMIYLEERDAGTVNVAFNDGRAEQIPYQPQKGFYNELLNFHNALTGQEPISVTPEIEFGDFKTVHCVLKSISEGTIIPVDADEHMAYQTAARPATETRPAWQ